MAAVLKHRRTSTAVLATLTPEAGELIENVDDKSLHIGDASAAAGFLIGGSSVKSVTATSYTTLVSDQGKLIVFNNASPIAVTVIQAGLTNNFGNGAGFSVLNIGAGTVTFTPAASLINGSSSFTLPSGASGKIVSDGTDYWVGATTSGGSLSGLSDVLLASLADRDILVYDSGTGKWNNHRARYTIGCSGDGVLTNSQLLLSHRLATGVTFPANFGSYLDWSSQAGGTANATASTVILVDKAPLATPNTFSNIGTITIGAGSVTPTFTTSGGLAQSGVQGDVIRVRGPASADATFAGFYLTLVGFES